jgi:uncharacterized protein YbcC (UPF0753/DUF2309 family)
VGGSHDTCSDSIDLFDLDLVPSTHRRDLQALREALNKAARANAHERTRRFEAAPLSHRPDQALRHVQERAEHLAEPRPEYGHCTNAVCIVGRRSLTRGLFLDRRAFLASYDAKSDPSGAALSAVLGAVVPVCAGISLEYFFSCIDNEGYGAGTKLPHNVTGLLGVVNGAEGDLRTGLVRQMVEIHEPVRILFVVENTRDAVLRAFHANPLLREFLENRWIRLATVDPDHAQTVHAYRGGGEWECIEGNDELLGKAVSSLDWYRGKRDHLPVARIETPAAKAVAA